MTVTLEHHSGIRDRTGPASGRWGRRSWWRIAGGATILAVLIWRVGTGPVIDGLATIDVEALLAAAAITAVTTLASAWRWSLVARGLGVAVPLSSAFAAYYRSQFLNTTLPGGVLGDLHRGVRHGRDAGDVGRSLRAVAWERGAGQAVQVVLALAVLLTLASPVRGAMPLLAGLVVGIGVLAGVLAAVRGRWTRPTPASSRPARALRAVRDDLRHGVLAHRAWPGITVASTVVVAGHALTFLIAARTAGVTAPVLQLLPLAMLVLLAMAVPMNIGGWGPREGAAAWLFGAAGLGAGPGVATATVYGVLVLAASLPGAAVLAGPALQRHWRRAHSHGRVDA